MDWTANVRFQKKLSRLDGIIATAARLGHPDGRALKARRQGQNNLQGHANALEPLAVLLAQTSPALLSVVKARTSLAANMGRGTTEARDSQITSNIASAIGSLCAACGSDIIAHELKSGNTITVDSACATYLSVGLNGGQTKGGGGDTVVKRVLKFLAQI